MPSCKRTKKNFQQLEADMDEEDQFPDSIPGWKNASKAAKSRMAAKYRRDKEAEYLDRLAELLPFPAEVTSKLDKASILRLTITYLKLREQSDNLDCGKYDWDKPPKSRRQAQQTFKNGSGQGINGMRVKETDLLMEALGGFIIFVSRQGRILYVSENVMEHIGFTQADMMGNKITAFMHNDDRREMCRQFAPSPISSTSFKNALPCGGNEENCLLKEDDDPDSINPRTFVCERSAFYLRMRYQVVKEGTKTKHSGYMLTQWSGRIQLSCSSCKNSRRAITGMVALCRPMQSSSITEIRLDGNMFMSRHNMDMKFTFCDPRILTLIGYEPTELLGRTAYDFHNPFDAQKIRKCHSNLIDKGQSVSKYYRFLGKNGEWVWMQTRATIIYNTSNEPQYVVCMNYVIGQDEGRRQLMMEQEDLKDQEIPKGAIDVTSLSSPGPAHSSGYCSADEDHSYSSSKTRETYSPGLQSPTGTFSSLGSGGSQPHSPPILTGITVPGPTMVTPSMLEEKMQFSAEDLNLFDMIGEMLPPVTSAGLSGLGSGSLTDSWITGLNSDIEMMDVDQGLGDAADSAGLLMNLLKDSDRCLAEIQQSQQGKLSPGTTPALGQPINDLGMIPPSTSAVITQSNVMLSSATQQTNGQLQSQTTCSKAILGMNQLPSMSIPSSSLPLALNIPNSSNNGVMANGTANLTVASFPSGMLGMTSDLDGSLSENTREFSLKYAENIVDQQISATLASYFDRDNLMDSNNTLGVQDAPINGLSDPSYSMLGNSTNPSLSPFMPSTSASPPSLSSPLQHPNCSSYQPQTGSRNVFATPAAPRQVLASSTCHNGGTVHTTKSTSPTSAAPKTVGQGQLQQQRPQVLKIKNHAPQRQQHKSSHNTSYPGLDDHRYTNKQLDSPPHHNNHHKSGGSNRNGHHKSNNHHRHLNHNNHHHHHHHHNGHSGQNGTHTPLLLERFLLTKEKLNPNKGSEAALATRGMSELHLGDRSATADSDLTSPDSNQQLLKKLLTEEINPKDVQKAQQEVIMDRRLSASSSPTCSSPPLSSFSMDLDDLQQSIQLLGEDTSSEMDKVWAPPGGDAIPSELDEILQEEKRQNDLWLQHCINELL